MVNKALFSSNTDEWGTPEILFELLDREFDFNLDPCGSRNRILKSKGMITYFPPENGLEFNWNNETVFVNPPYSEIASWCEKCFNESFTSNIIVMLVPSRTDTRYWHNYIMKAKEIRFIKGRLKFGGSKNCAPFPVSIVIFNDMIRGSKRRPKCSTFDLKTLSDSFLFMSGDTGSG